MTAVLSMPLELSEQIHNIRRGQWRGADEVGRAFAPAGAVAWDGLPSPHPSCLR